MKPKKEETEKDITDFKMIDETDSLESEYDTIKLITDVHSKSKLTKDFVLARFDQKDREFVAEMEDNAKFARGIIETYGRKGHRYEWDSRRECWIKRRLNQKEMNEIEYYKTRIYIAYVNKLNSLAILSRNVKNNYIVRGVFRIPDEIKDEESEKVIETFSDKLKRKFSRNKDKPEEKEDEEQ